MRTTMTVKHIIDSNPFLGAEDFMHSVQVTGVDPYNTHDSVREEAAKCSRPSHRLTREINPCS